VYVNEVCDVTIYDADGTQQIVFTAGYAASAIEVRSPSFTGEDYNYAFSTAAGQPVSLQAVLDGWASTHLSTDWGLGDSAAPFVVVTDAIYGAKADGVTDDSAAILAAVAAAEPGGIVYFPAGDYRVSQTITASGITLVGCDNYIIKDGATTAVHLASCNVLNLAFTSTGSGNLVEAFGICSLWKTSFQAHGGKGLVLEASAEVYLTQCRFIPNSGDGEAIDASAGITRLTASNCYFATSGAAYTPPSGAVVYGDQMHLDGCRFATSSPSGTFAYIKFSTATIVGTVRACHFEGTAGATITAAMVLGAYGSGSRFYESESTFSGTGITLYSYTASVATSGVELCSRNHLVRNLTDNSATVALPTDQYGVIILTSTHASPVMTGTLPPYGAKGTVIFYHPSGGAGTAQPTTNFFGSTAAVTANTSSHAWEYISAAPNSALRMVCTVDARALGNGAP
jgi:hypothetical protein